MADVNNVASPLGLPTSIIGGFSTMVTVKSIGGLLLCGINSGTAHIGNGKIIPGLDYGWTPYFSHIENEHIYQVKFMNWFKCWGHTLCPDQPGDMDYAISQTNMNLHLPEESPDHEAESGRYIALLRTLTAFAKRLDMSGVLFISSEFVSNVNRELQLYTKRHEGLLFDAETNWTSVESGRLNLEFSESSGIKLAKCAHPRNAVPYSHIDRSSHAMGKWLDDVLLSYRVKQYEIRTTASYGSSFQE